MMHLVISDNKFLKISLNNFLEKDDFKFNVCIVDLNSCKSLSQLESLLSLDFASHNYRILFLFGRNIYSKLLSKFVGVKMTSRYTEISRVIKSRSLHSTDEINWYISKLKNFKFFHPKELFFTAMFVIFGINETCNLSKLSSSSIYRILLSSANKLNLSSTRDLGVFLSAEFSIEELKLLVDQYGINYIDESNKPKDGLCKMVIDLRIESI